MERGGGELLTSVVFGGRFEHYASNTGISLYSPPPLYLLKNTMLSTTSLSRETVTSVLGITGSKVSLPCNITPPVQDDAVALILWYKDDITKPIYSVDARKTSVDQARHVTGQAVSSRVSLSLEDNPSMLYLEFLTEEDEGEYRCRVDFRRARSRNGIVFLQLVGKCCNGVNIPSNPA
ncbi:UNVERIFIED_CONTAM: hypothetical protein NCL1_12355 [Trichonephila clavipes]